MEESIKKCSNHRLGRAAKYVIVLRGPTQSGKSTISKELCKQLGFKRVDIDKIGDKTPPAPSGDFYAHFDRYERVLSEACKVSAKYLDQGFNIVIEEAFAERVYLNYLNWFILEPLKRMHKTKTFLFYIQCPLPIALERDRASDRKIGEQVIQHQFSRFKDSDDIGIVIDTSPPKQVEEEIKIIKECLEKG